jgi:hypothetical protein
LAGQTAPRVGTQLFGLGDNALKDERPAISEELEEMLVSHHDSQRELPNGEIQTFRATDLTIERVKALPSR